MQHAHKHHGADEVVTGSIPNASADKNVTGRNGRIKSQGCGDTDCAVSRLFDLKGHIALVTGANHGIGAATARTLASCGAAVVLNYLAPT